MTKICAKCFCEKPVTEYYSGEKRTRTDCKSCCRASALQRYQKNVIKNRATARAWKSKNPARTKELFRNWREKNLEKELIRGRVYKKQNRQRLRIKQKEWLCRSGEKQLQCRLAINLRTRINIALKSATKSAPLASLLGCTVPELKLHLEKQFAPGMTWDNHSRTGWHMDHIKPCASFDLKDPAQQHVCFHFSNLQPLWAIKNLQKGSKHGPKTF